MNLWLKSMVLVESVLILTLINMLRETGLSQKLKLMGIQDLKKNLVCKDKLTGRRISVLPINMEKYLLSMSCTLY